MYLVSDDTVYTDDAGNYILSDSSAGQELLANTDVYYSATIEGDFRSVGGADSVTPFNSGNNFLVFFGKNASSDKIRLPKGIYTLETVAGCFSLLRDVPYIYLYSNDALFHTAARTTYTTNSSGTINYCIVHSIDTITLEEDSEIYLKHSAGASNPFAMSVLYN